MFQDYKKLVNIFVMYIFPNFNFYSTVENYELNNYEKNVGPYFVMLFLESSENMARPLVSKFDKTVD